MSTDETPKAPDADERIRKVYVKDLKVGDAVHTVFRVANKEKHTSRGGKSFLAFSLQDRTGEVDGRVFEAVETAEKTFVDGDYLLVKGKVGVFHGKNQVVLETAERLDPTPLDEKEFTPPPQPKEAAPAREPRAEGSPEGKDTRKATRARILRLLDDPQILDGLTAFLRHIDGGSEDRGAQPSHEPKRQRPPRGPRVEHRPDVKPGAPAHPVEPKKPGRDPSLPGAFAFKPFSAVAAVVPGPESPAEPPATEGSAAEAPKP